MCEEIERGNGCVAYEIVYKKEAEEEDFDRTWPRRFESRKGEKGKEKETGKGKEEMKVVAKEGCMT